MQISILLSGLSLIIPCLALAVINPPLLITLLIIQSILVVCFVGLMKSIWYSYILFMVFLGGMLVIFTYVCSLAGNKKSQLSLSIFYSVSVLLIFCGMLSLSSTSLLLGELTTSVMGEEFVIHSLMSFWGESTYSYVIIYLLLVLYCVCWLVKTSEGPLRSLK